VLVRALHPPTGILIPVVPAPAGLPRRYPEIPAARGDRAGPGHGDCGAGPAVLQQAENLRPLEAGHLSEETG